MAMVQNAADRWIRPGFTGNSGVRQIRDLFHGSEPGKEKTPDNVHANCSIGIAWSDDLQNWDWPRQLGSPNR